MRINLTASEIEQRKTACYHGDSPPLSKNTRPRSAQSVDWWTSNPRLEYVDTDRKTAALKLYIELAQRSVDPRPHVFPASFEARDGECFRPDKGVIKVCLQNSQALIRISATEPELMFELTDEGMQRLADDLKLRTAQKA